jgi:hypothetical protein
MRVQLCWRKKGNSKLHISALMKIQTAKSFFNAINKEEIILAYLRRWEGYKYLCHKVLKDNKERKEEK